MVNFNESHHGSSPCGEMGLGELVPKAFNASPSIWYYLSLYLRSRLDHLEGKPPMAIDHGGQ